MLDIYMKRQKSISKYCKVKKKHHNFIYKKKLTKKRQG